MTDDKNIDDLFRERLQFYEQEPPPEMWANILQQLPQKKNNRRIVWIRWSAVAAMLFLAVSTGIVLTHRSITVEPEQLSVDTSDQKQNSSVQPDNPTPDATGFGKLNRFTAPSGIVESSSVMKEEIAENTPENANSGLTPGQREAILFTSLKKIQPELLASAYERQLKSKNENSAVQEFMEKDRSRGEFSKAPKVGKRSESDKGWSVGVRVNPAYSSFSNAYSEAYASKLNQTGEPLRASLGGGISICYRASSRWQIESGLQYSQSSDQPKGAHLFAAKADYAVSPEPGYKYYNSTFSADNGQPSINGAAGVIQFDKTPANAELVTLPESTIGLSTALLTSGELSQVFDFIEFPLNLHYRLLNKKPVIDLFSGISTNLLVGNNVFIENQAGNERVGKTRDISTLSFAATAGIGIMVPLSKHFTFSLEPQTNFSLNSLNHSADVVYRPWRIGVYSGLSYNF